MNEKALDRIERRMAQEYSKLNPTAFGDMLDLVAEVRRQREEIENLKLCMDSKDYYGDDECDISLS